MVRLERSGLGVKPPCGFTSSHRGDHGVTVHIEPGTPVEHFIHIQLPRSREIAGGRKVNVLLCVLKLATIEGPSSRTRDAHARSYHQGPRG